MSNDLNHADLEPLLPMPTHAAAIPPAWRFPTCKRAGCMAPEITCAAGEASPSECPHFPGSIPAGRTKETP